MKYIYNYLVVFCMFILAIRGENSKNGDEKDEKNCIIWKDGKKLSDADWENGIKLREVIDTTAIVVHLFKYKTENIDDVFYFEYSGGEIYNYIDLYIDDYNEDNYYLIIQTGAFFDDYEDHETELEMTVNAKFECRNNKFRYLNITVPVKDTNNHDPILLNAPYNYHNLPMPLPKGFVFDPLIRARDVDLTNTNIKFEFDKNDTGLEVISSGRVEKDVKNYTAIFRTIDTIDLENDISLVLYATDSGIPPRKTNTTITITIDKANSHPRFSEPFYIANLTNLDYKKVKNTEVQFLENRNVTLDRGFTERIKFEIRELSDENKKHFKLRHGDPLYDHGIDTYVELVNITDKFLRQKEIVFLLIAIDHQLEAQTVLRIILPKVPIDVYDSPVICVEESNSLSGYMVATIILSLVIICVVVFIGYLIFYKNVR